MTIVLLFIAVLAAVLLCLCLQLIMAALSCEKAVLLSFDTCQTMRLQPFRIANRLSWTFKTLFSQYLVNMFRGLCGLLWTAVVGWGGSYGGTDKVGIDVK